MDNNLTYYNLPSHWACAFINDDFTAFDNAEFDEITVFTNRMVAEHGRCECADVSMETWIGLWDGLLTELTQYAFYTRTVQ